MADQFRVQIDVWSDYVCPFCYLELPTLNRIKAEFGADVHVVWHAFELRPDPVPTLDPDGDYLHEIWSRSVYPMATRYGMTLRLPPVQPRSRKAFEAVCHARDIGRFDDMHLALFKGFFEDGKDIGDKDTLLNIAESVGIDKGPLNAALVNGRYTPLVIQDEEDAARLGISGVPLTFVRGAGSPLATAIALRGAVPYDGIRSAVEHVLG